MPAVSKNGDFGRLPRKAWLHVLEYLDAESRLNVGDIGPSFKELAVDNDLLLQTVRCDPPRRRGLLKMAALPWSMGAREEAVSEQLRRGTAFGAARVRPHVLEPDRTKSLEWTLHCDHQLRRHFEAARVGRFSFALSERLHDMYVEVESAEHPSFQFLKLMLCQSSRMWRLHVHVIVDARQTSVQQCTALAVPLLSVTLSTFVFTTDEDVTSMCRRSENLPRGPLNLEQKALVCGNVSMDYKGGFSSCIWLDDLVRSGPGNEEQIVLVADDSAAARKLDFAAASYTWAKVKALTLVSTIVQARDVPGSPRLCDAITNLLNACGYITELNLNAFHFPESAFFSGLPRGFIAGLRAISVSPCFFMGGRFCLTWLASACGMLEELDVRMNYVGIHKGSCGPCRYGSFSLRPHEWRTTGTLIRLRRLTFSCTAQLNWFTFVSACDVEELQLRGREFGLCSNVALSLLLTGNSRLYSLLLEDDGLRLDDDLLLRELAKAPRLRYLCLVSNVTLSFEAVEASASALVRTLPALQVLHVHFRNRFSAELERMSWIRRGYVHRYEPRTYQMTVNCACVLCSTSTFIGLAKPRYRYSGGL
ncbi:hypothetical protein MTO96_046540 [Rhipicephalus appendiculatus]